MEKNQYLQNCDFWISLPNFGCRIKLDKESCDFWIKKWGKEIKKNFNRFVDLVCKRAIQKIPAKEIKKETLIFVYEYYNLIEKAIEHERSFWEKIFIKQDKILAQKNKEIEEKDKEIKRLLEQLKVKK